MNINNQISTNTHTHTSNCSHSHSHNHNHNQIQIDTTQFNNTLQELSPLEIKQKENEDMLFLNKEKYINLVEGNEKIDVTESIKSYIKSMEINKRVHTEKFNYEETMSAVEIDHPKMDPHYRYNEEMTYKKGIRQGRIKSITQLEEKEILSIMDNLMMKEVQWLRGGSINLTLMTFLYFHIDDKEENEDKKKEMRRINQLLLKYIDLYRNEIYIVGKLNSVCNSIKDEEMILNFTSMQRKIENEREEEEENSQDQNNQSKYEVSIYKRYRYKYYMNLLYEILLDERLCKKDKLTKFLEMKSKVTSSIKKIQNDMTLYTNDEYSEIISLSSSFFNASIYKTLPIAYTIKQINPISQKDFIIKLNETEQSIDLLEKLFYSKDIFQLGFYLEKLNLTTDIYIYKALAETIIFTNEKNSLSIFEKDKENHTQEDISHGNIIEDSLVLIFKSFFSSINKEMDGLFLIIEKINKSNDVFDIFKESLVNLLRKKSIQTRVIPSIYLGLLGISQEITSQLSSINSSQTMNFFNMKESVYPQLIKKMLLSEVLYHINTEMWLGIYSAHELDFVFFVMKVVSEEISNTLDFLHSQLGKVRKEDMSLTEKGIFDEVIVFNIYKSIYNCLCLFIIWLKDKQGFACFPEGREKERIRISRRFSSFKHLDMILQFDYERFNSLRKGVVKDGELNGEYFDKVLKGGEMKLKSLKEVCKDLRFNDKYNDSFIDNTIKVIMSNRLLIAKTIKSGIKNTGKTRLVIDFKKYNVFLPVVSLVEV